MATPRRGTESSSRRLTGLQVESWRLLWEQLVGDGEAVAELREWEARRRAALPEMHDALARFLAGDLTTGDLRSAVARGARGDWGAFGLRGSSGALFLATLVKHSGDRDALAGHLRRALPAPRDDGDAEARLRELVAFLESRRRIDERARRIQSAHAAFFASLWWHAQDTERWPAFQPSARRALRREMDVYAPAGDAPSDYVLFRGAFRAVMSALHVTAWELEFLCRWHEQRAQRERAEEDDPGYEPGALRRPAARERARSLGLLRVREPAPPPAPRVASAAPEHTHVQWLLAKLGRALGCRVWIAANDRAREWRGETLESMSLRRLPALGLDADAERVVSLIDVVWLRGREVAAAFEVEHTTSIYSGLLRMADLAALSPNLSFPLYIVAPRLRLEKVRRELSRPSFRRLGLDRRCAYFASETLIDEAEGIMRWSDDPAAIAKLGLRVDA